MPQPGIHAILALATRKTFSKERWFALGLTFGALIPDADGYPQAFAFLLAKMDPHRAEEIFHRTLTHSWFFALAIALIFYIAARVRKEPALQSFGFGLAIGMAILHTFVDIFAWFDGVGILWPLWSVNLWEGVVLPDLVVNLLRSANFLAFAGYFFYLLKIADKSQTDQAYTPNLKRYMYMQLGLGIIFTVLAFILTPKAYNTPDGAVFLFLAYPNVLWVTWKMKATIEAG